MLSIGVIARRRSGVGGAGVGLAGAVAAPGRVCVRMVEHVQRAVGAADREVEDLAGLRVLDGDRHVAVGRLPE